MGVQPLNLEDRIEIVDPDYHVVDQFAVTPEDTFMGFTWGRVNLGHMRRQFVFEDVVQEWFGNVNHHQTIEINPHRGWYVYGDGIYRFRTNMDDMKEQDRKAKKEKEYKDLMNQILNHIDVSYKCDYYLQKEVEHSYPPSAPISFLVR